MGPHGKCDPASGTVRRVETSPTTSAVAFDDTTGAGPERYLAIDLGRTRLAAGVVDGEGTVLVRDRVSTPARHIWPTLARLVSRVGDAVGQLAMGLEPAPGRGQFFGGATNKHDLCAEIEKESCGCLADPAGGSGDDGHLAVETLFLVQIAHCCLRRDEFEGVTMSNWTAVDLARAGSRKYDTLAGA